MVLRTSGSVPGSYFEDSHYNVKSAYWSKSLDAPIEERDEHFLGLDDRHELDVFFAEQIDPKA
jgi:hypothetical protein